MSEAEDSWDTEIEEKVAYLMVQVSASIQNATYCGRERTGTVAMVEAISPTAASLEHFPEIKSSCIEAAHAALRQMGRKPDSAEYAAERANIVRSKNSMTKGKSPMPLNMSLFIAIFSLGGLDVTIQEHFPEHHDMDTGLQSNFKRSNVMIIKIETVRTFPTVTSMIQSNGVLNTAVCESFLSEYECELEPVCNSLLLLTMYGYYNGEKFESLVFPNKKKIKSQLQAGTQKNMHTAGQMPLLAGKIMHLSHMRWDQVCQQDVGCLRQAMDTCPGLKLSIPSFGDM